MCYWIGFVYLFYHFYSECPGMMRKIAQSWHYPAAGRLSLLFDSMKGAKYKTLGEA